MLVLAGGFFYLMMSSYSGSNANMWNHTGSDGGVAGCEGGGCHAFSTTANVAVYLDIAYLDGTLIGSDIYVPEETYRMTLRGYTSGGIYPVAGFQFSGSGLNDGNFVTTSGITSQVIPPYQILQHEYPLPATGNQASVSFYWQAPPAGSGEVKFYGVMMLANNDQTPHGDVAYSLVRSVREAPTAVRDITKEIRFQLYPMPVSAVLHIEAETDRPEGVFTLQVYDLSGKNIFVSEANSREGRIKTSLSVDGWAAGMYLLQISGHGERGTVPFMVR